MARSADAEPTPSAALLGYVRVSTTNQSTDQQEDALRAAGVEQRNMYGDKLSGSAGTERPGLDALLGYAREGDVIMVAGIDRLGRSVAEVAATIAALTERGIVIRALREGVDTSTPTGRMVATIMASVAELELELGRERRAAAREARRVRGLPTGRPRALPADRAAQLVRLAATGEPVPALADTFGISARTAYRIVAAARSEDACQNAG
ncbi:DNA recombinase [Mycobacteroides abscessus subsp. abscessus]|nr:DNA recombinase [Mycobacteroides abscessus subsp. abscessus]